MTASTETGSGAKTDAPSQRIGLALTTLFAVACGALAANLYYAQPLVALIGADTGLSLSTESVIVTVAQIGYAIGLVFLVPLGDIVENRKLILATMALNVVSLVGLALAPGLASLFAMMLVVGVTSCAAQMIVPLAANLAPSAERGAVVGNVMTGLLGGILLARPVASFLADYITWRGVFAASAALVGLVLLVGLLRLPARTPTAGKGYGELIGSLGKLFANQPVLRRRGLYHASMFGAFSLFWTAAPIILLREPFNFSSTEVALFTLAGVFGVFAAPLAGSPTGAIRSLGPPSRSRSRSLPSCSPGSGRRCSGPCFSPESSSISASRPIWCLASARSTSSTPRSAIG